MKDTCDVCGAKLMGISDTVYCPECGTIVEPQKYIYLLYVYVDSHKILIDPFENELVAMAEKQKRIDNHKNVDKYYVIVKRELK